MADSALQRVGTPVVSGSMFTDGMVKIEGPLSQIDRIAGVKVIVDTVEVISDVTSYMAPLTAVDEQGQPVEMDQCTFVGAEENAVNVTVPVEYYKRIDFTYQLVDVPSGYDTSKLVTLSPSHVEVWGPRQDVEAFAERVSDLGVISLNNLTQHDLVRTVSLNAPDTVSVAGGEKAVTLTIGLKNIDSVALTVPLKSTNVSFVNVPEGFTPSVSTAQLSIMLCGPSKTVKAVKADAETLTVDLSSVTAVGQYELIAKVSVDKNNTVWAYYGAADSGLSVGVTVTARE